MTAINWKSGVNGNWATAADWSTGTIPGAAADVTIGVTGTYTVTINAIEAAHLVTVNNATARLSEVSGGVLSVAGSLAITAGTLALASGAILQGGTLSVGSGGHFLSTGGTLSGVTIQGPVTLGTSQTINLENGRYRYRNEHT